MTLFALSLSAPWTQAIEKHGKRAENRPRWVNAPGMISRARTLVGHDVALHSSGTWDADGAEYIRQVTGVTYTRRNSPMKAVTSVARLERVLMPGDPCPVGQEAWYWGDIALLLEDVRPLPRPVPMKGGLGWLKVEGTVIEEIRAQVEVRE